MFCSAKNCNVLAVFGCILEQCIFHWSCKTKCKTERMCWVREVNLAAPTQPEGGDMADTINVNNIGNKKQNVCQEPVSFSQSKHIDEHTKLLTVNV